MFLGIDVGTGGTRAVLIDRAGKVLASHSADHAPIASAHIGWAEQDPEDWWRAAQEAILGALKDAAGAGHGNKVEAVGLTGQMHGCVMLDRDGGVLRPALIWCDQRTQPEADWLNHTIGYEKIIQLVANPALPNFTLTKLLWVRQHQPEIFKQIAHVLCPKDYVRFRVDLYLRHRHAGGLRHPAARRRAPPLVAGSRQRRRDPDVMAASTL